MTKLVPLTLCWRPCRPIVSTFSNCRIRNAVPSSSNGRTERKEFSSWWTARRSPGCGGCIKTSPTWITKQWAAHSGILKLLLMKRFLTIKHTKWMQKLSESDWKLKILLPFFGGFLHHYPSIPTFINLFSAGITTSGAFLPRWTDSGWSTSSWTCPSSGTSWRWTAAGRPPEPHNTQQTQPWYYYLPQPS